MEPLTFRSKRSTAAVYFGLFLMPVAFVLVVYSLDVAEIDLPVAVTCLLFGALAAWGGAGLLCLRTVVDGTGIRRSPWWFGGYRVRWENVSGWSVRSLDPIDHPNDWLALDLSVRDRLLPVRILDCEVARPGFDALVERVKACIGASE